MNEQGAFEKDTLYRMLVEATRYWVVENHLRTKSLPDKRSFFVYSGGPNGIGWGNPPGPDGENQPLRYKRIRVTLEIEDDQISHLERTRRLAELTELTRG